MSVSYSGVHSITFFKDDDNSFKNSWGDFHMVPTSRPYITPPPAQIKMVSLPRSNKVLDLTNALTSDVIYDAREGDWEFYIDHDQWEDWTQAFDEISEYLDGSVFHVVLADEPLYSYKGRVYVSDYSPEPNYSKFRVHYSLDAICEVYEYSDQVSEYDYDFNTQTIQYIDDEEWYIGDQLASMAVGVSNGGIRFDFTGASHDQKYYCIIEMYKDGASHTIIIEIKNLYGIHDYSSMNYEDTYGNCNYTGFALFPKGYTLPEQPFIRIGVKVSDYDGKHIRRFDGGSYSKISEIVI